MSIVSRTAAAGLVLSLAANVAWADAAADLATLKTRYTDGMAAKKIDAAGIENFLAAQQPDGSFNDIDYASTLVNDGWQPHWHLNRLNDFAAAYLSADPKYGKSDRLKAATLRGIDYWLAKDYPNKNWFWNQIGVPGRLADSLLVFYGDLPADRQKKAIDILNRAKIEGSGTNLVWLAEIVAKRGIIQNDPALIKTAFARIAADIKMVTAQKDGPQADNTYLYHGPLLYTWGYGISYLRDNARLAGLVGGTSFAMPADKVKLVRDWTLYGAQWLARYNAPDYNGLGRNIARKHQDASILAEIGRDLIRAKVGREDELQAMVDRTVGPDPEAAPPLVGNRMFWRADLMAHHRPDFYVSARLYSTRTKNAEWGNGEALRSWYVADGATVLMRDGREYYDIFPVWDWQRPPGTTVELIPDFGPVAGKPDGDPLGFVPTRNGITRLGKQSFVGGASDGRYGVFGGKFTRDKLGLNRAWFFFDDVFVCLGGGLTCDTVNPVVTTLDQTALRGPVTVADANGTQTYGGPGDTGATGPGEHGSTAAAWLLHDGVGYVFDKPVGLRFSNAKQKGDWRDISIAYPSEPVEMPVFKAWIEHGQQLKDAAYAYSVYPKTDAAALARAADPGTSAVKIVSNTANVQAVWHTQLRRGGAMAYLPGSIELRPGLTVTVDKPCAVYVAETAAGANVSVANPENKELTVRVTLAKDGKSTFVDLVLPRGVYAGHSATQSIRL